MVSKWKNLAGVMLAAPTFFAVKVAIGLLVVNFSSKYLEIDQFVDFSQYFLLLALVNVVAGAGVQSGVIAKTASAPDEDSRRTIVRAALIIWMLLCLCLAPLSILFRDGLAMLLVAHTQDSATVPILVCVGLMSGAGQILCALLTGIGRAPASLVAQTVGLALGGGASLALLWRGEAISAVTAYALGQLATTVVAFLLSRRFLFGVIARATLRSEIRSLFGFSASFLIIAVLTPSALFVLRYVFRESFGVEALGRWLVANRISDVSTQLLGLFIGQAFLPAFAATHDPDAARRLVRNVMFAATIGMAFVLGIFSLAPTLLIHTFLSDQYLSAQGAIQAYMAGDVFRVAAAVLMNVSLARRRLRLAVASELLPAFMLMAVTGALIMSGRESAPFIGYLSANVATSMFFLWLWRQGRIP